MIRCVALAIALTTEPSYDLSHATHFGRSSSGPESTAATPARKPPTAWPQTFSAPALFLDMGQSVWRERREARSRRQWLHVCGRHRIG